MNKEEKEAIENLKHIVEYWKPDDENDELANIEYNSIKVAVELIDKLQKENEELKEKYENINWYFENQKDNFVHKDKIRTKIKELEKEMNREDIQEEHFWCVEAERSVLVELLGE